MDKEDAVRCLIVTLTKYNPECVRDMETDIRIALKDYEIKKLETEIVVYEGSRNEQFLKHFLISKMVQGCTDRTLQLYECELRRILGKIGKNADEITPDDIRLYLAIRERNDNVTKTTIGNEFRYLSSFFGHLHNEEKISKNPISRLQRPKQPKTKKDAFSELEIEMLRMSCSTKRETALIEVLLSTGCRVSELVQITREQAQGTKLRIIGKGQKERTVFLNAKAQVAIKRYLEERKDDNPFLFCGSFYYRGRVASLKGIAHADWYKRPENVSPDKASNIGSIESAVRKIGKLAGVENCHPHRFRRTCATMALRHGMPIEQVSMMLGHVQVSTTQIYLDLREEDLEISHTKYVV